MATSEKVIELSNRVKSIKSSSNPEINHIIAGADDIFDDSKHKKQSTINQEIDEALNSRYTKDETYNKSEVYSKDETYNKNQLNNLITTPNQGYVTVEDYASLPESGEADTIYRVSNWDGSLTTPATDITKYSEYAWDGTQYVFLNVKSQIGDVFDISAYNSNTEYVDLAAALGNDGANVPASIRRGGMSVKFVCSSDHKYVQYRYMLSDVSTAVTFTNVANWQGVDDRPIAGSNNLVKSGGVFKFATKTIGANLSAGSNVWLLSDGTTAASSSARTFRYNISEEIRFVKIKCRSIAIGSTYTNRCAYIIYNSNNEILFYRAIGYYAYNIEEIVDLGKYTGASYIIIGCSSEYADDCQVKEYYDVEKVYDILDGKIKDENDRAVAKEAELEELIDENTEVIKESLISSSSFTRVKSYRLDDDGVWHAGSSSIYGYGYVMLKAGDYKLTANTNPLYYTLLTQAPTSHNVGESPSYVSGYTTIKNIAANGYAEFTVSSPCYLYISNSKGSLGTNSPDATFSSLLFTEYMKLVDIINSITNEEAVYDIENEVVKAFWDNTQYNQNDYSYSEISNYIASTDYRRDQPKSIEINVGDSVVKARVSLYPGFSSYIDFVCANNKVELTNLLPNKTYFIRLLDSSNNIVEQKTFQTSGSLRMIKIDSLTNVRDLGGKKTIDNKTIRYGLIYRGEELNNSSGTAVVTNDEISVMTGQLAISAELDFRNSTESGGITGSVLGSGVTYNRIEAGVFGNVHGAGSHTDKERLFADVLEALLTNLRAGKTTYMHCQGGCDRTGCVSAILEGLCGVSEGDISKDYETSSFNTKNFGNRYRSSNGAGTPDPNHYFRLAIGVWKNYSGNTLQEKMENYVVDLGMSSSDVKELVGYLVF